jgi:hypothetical protein
VTVTYFDGPVLATDEPLHNGEASIGYPAWSGPRGAGQPAVRPALQPTAGRAIARLSVRGRRPEIGRAGMGLEHTSDRTNVMFKYTIVPWQGRSGDAGGVAC